MIVMENINKLYTADQEQIHVLKNISLTIEEHEFVAVMGPSGSGKSTLINTISFLDGDFEGSYRFEGEDAYRFNDEKLSALRNKSVGFVFQAFQLIDNNTVMENVALPLLYGGMKQKQTKPLVMEALRKVGIADKYNKEEKVTILMVTHDPEAAAYCQRIITVKDGEILEEGVAHAV